ncbi:MAG: rhodanese-like domain-containing protein [Acidobacteria bacterium]|nr:rhodanese-like domain-containing protein [Acidobacteriota bacterium]
MKRYLAGWVAGVCLMALAMAAPARAAEVPRIGVGELKKMMDEGVAVTVIDVQSREAYAEGHIKGALSIPWQSQIALEDVWSLPADQLIVTYCDCGPGEADSADFARQLFQMGYENVKILADPSIREWREKGYPVEK